MPGKLMISVMRGVPEERLLLIHEGFPRGIGSGRGILIPSFCNGSHRLSNCCLFPFSHCVSLKLRVPCFLQSSCRSCCVFQKTDRLLLVEMVCKLLSATLSRSPALFCCCRAQRPELLPGAAHSMFMACFMPWDHGLCESEMPA